MPLANALVDDGDETPEALYPLDLVRCPRCDLVQITETVPPEILFRDYAYFTSFSDSFVAHARAYATQMRERLELDEGSLVVEAASNDGYLLRFFAEAGVPVLGVDPARNVAEAARARGVETIAEFLDRDLASKIVAERGRHADLVIANNVLAHVADLHGFVGALRILAGDTGIVSVEVPYVCELVDRLEFDTIYHEHLCYFSLTSLRRLFAANDLTVVDVERIPVHGGSLRVLASAGRTSPTAAVDELLERERQWGVGDPVRYAGFAQGVEEVRESIGALVRDLAASGERVAGYGAAAKAVVLLHATGLGRSQIDYVVDRNPYKQHKLLPGVRIPVRPPEALLDDPPRYVLLFVWNIAPEVIEQQRAFLAAGGSFIVPIPTPSIVGAPTSGAGSQLGGERG
jgi:SAM-dependent methyltransferase